MLLSFLVAEERRLMAQFDDFNSRNVVVGSRLLSDTFLLLPTSEQPPRHVHSSLSSVNV